MEMEVGEARPLSFLPSSSLSTSFFLLGDLPGLLSLVVNFVGLLLEFPNFPTFVGDSAFWLSVLYLLIFNDGDSASLA